MDQIPESWLIASLLEISQIIRGITYSKRDVSNISLNGLMPIIRANNITEKSLMFDDLVYVPRKLAREIQVIRANDVLVATSSGSINVVGKAKQTREDLDASFGTFCAVIRPSRFLEPRYFGHYFGTQDYRRKISSFAIGININNLKSSDFGKIFIPIPPVKEQKRIADKLDSLLARVDACRDHLERVPGILKRFRQSVLSAAVSGKLTEDWRREHHISLEMDWDINTFNNLIEDGPKNGLYKHISNYGKGTCILRIDMFYDGEVMPWSGIKRLTLNDQEKTDYALSIGDIVINRVNSLPFLGKSALIRSLPEFCIFESNLMRIKVNKARILPEYCIRYLCSPQGLISLRKNAKLAVNQASINQTDIKSIKIPLPPIHEQLEIIRRVEILFALASQIEVHYHKAYTDINNLSPSILTKAFRGELVPQDPDDEPAPVLLERIRAEKAMYEAGGKRTAKTGKT